MPSKKLMGCWAFVDVCLLAAGIIALVFSIVWKEPNLLRNFIISSADLKGRIFHYGASVGMLMGSL